MDSNIVNVKGMFGADKTYFTEAPVLIEIGNLYWGDPVTTPFTVVNVEVVYSKLADATGEEPYLEDMFPNSNAPFNNDYFGYINGAAIVDIPGTDYTHAALMVTSYNKSGKLEPLDRYRKKLINLNASQIVSEDRHNDCRIVELDSNTERRDALIRYCSEIYGGRNDVVGNFPRDVGGLTKIDFDISSALRAIWSDYDFGPEVAAADMAINGTIQQTYRPMRRYSLQITTEYIAEDGTLVTTTCQDADGNKLIPGGQCTIGGLTEWERYTIGKKEYADVSYYEHTGVRYGDASTKPLESPERVGRDSITSWVDVQKDFTRSIFFPANYNNGEGEPDDQPLTENGWTGHAPIVLRDSIPYIDFLFLNRRGAIETCSGQTLESMGINIKVTQYSKTEHLSFSPVRSLMAIGQDGRRSWQMSSGYVSREWAEWWAMEFLGGKRKQWWMRYPIGDPNGTYVPVIVEPAKQSIGIYDRAKQNMAHVDFTVTLALEG